MNTRLTTPKNTKQFTTVGRELQDTLVDLIDLGLQAKQAHWNVAGLLFRPVHQHLDELVDAYRGWEDEVAERAVAIGTAPDGRASTVARHTKLEEFPAGQVRDREVVALFTARLDEVIERMRGRVERTESEPISQDLLIEITQGLEKQRWMLHMQQS